MHTTLSAQDAPTYWGANSPLLSFRLPMTGLAQEATYDDLDGDGDPDILSYQLDSVSIKWIDDDDDMQPGALEGDLDSDCLLTDLNGDGIFGGPHDLIIDWNDENGDQVADLQVFIQQAPHSEAYTGPYEPDGYYRWQIDYDQDNVFHHVDWRSLALQAWDRDGIADFFQDYAGDLTITQAQVASYNMRDLTFNWENPFHSYDPDQDGLTEYSIRFAEKDVAADVDYDLPAMGDTLRANPNFHFHGQVNEATIAFDIDNDNDAERLFDYDFAVHLQGKGFQYDKRDQHRFKSMRGLPGTDSLFYDPRFRQMDHLTFAPRNKAQRMMFEEGEWEQAYFVFDEDDDCRRWDQVSWVEPFEPFTASDQSADVRGDRAEWDLDYSGEGMLYVSPLDGRLHLYGAERGLWQVDQQARHYQNRNRPWEGDPYADNLVTFLYQDTDSNGFVDEIRIDLDGDRKVDEVFSSRALGISDEAPLVHTGRWTYEEANAMFRRLATHQWRQAQLALETAQAYGLNPQWYAFYRNPKSVQQQYDYGTWLCFYIYHDLQHLMQHDLDRQNDLYRIKRAFLSTNWTLGPPRGN